MRGDPRVKPRVKPGGEAIHATAAALRSLAMTATDLLLALAEALR